MLAIRSLTPCDYDSLTYENLVNLSVLSTDTLFAMLASWFSTLDCTYTPPSILPKCVNTPLVNKTICVSPGFFFSLLACICSRATHESKEAIIDLISSLVTNGVLIFAEPTEGTISWGTAALGFAAGYGTSRLLSLFSGYCERRAANAEAAPLLNVAVAGPQPANNAVAPVPALNYGAIN
jgi:hypothetical protein